MLLSVLTYAQHTPLLSFMNFHEHVYILNFFYFWLQNFKSWGTSFFTEIQLEVKFYTIKNSSVTPWAKQELVFLKKNLKLPNNSVSLLFSSSQNFILQPKEIQRLEGILLRACQMRGVSNGSILCFCTLSSCGPSSEMQVPAPLPVRAHLSGERWSVLVSIM